MIYAGLDFVTVEDNLELLIPCLHLFRAGDYRQAAPCLAAVSNLLKCKITYCPISARGLFLQRLQSVYSGPSWYTSQ